MPVTVLADAVPALDPTLTSALSAGFTSIGQIFLAACVLAIPTGFLIWGIKTGIRVAPSIIQSFMRKQ